MSAKMEERLAARNPYVLYEIKKLLRSRCSDTKLSAVNVVESCLHDEPVGNVCPLREFMLEEDLVGFLCDAMATNSWPLLERVTHVLELLSDSDKMVQEGHAVVAVEAAQRRAHFLGLMVSSTSTDCESALEAILGLMSTLLERWGMIQGTAQCVSNLCPPQGLLSTLRLVLEARGTSPTTVLSAARMLCSLMRLLSVGGEPGDPAVLAASVATSVRAASGSLQRMLRLHGDRDDDDQDGGLDEEERRSAAEGACESLCAITARVTCLRSACEKLKDPEYDDALQALERIEAEMQQVMVDKCLPLVVKVARTRIESSDEPDVSAFLADASESQGPGQPGMTWVLLDSLETSLALGRDGPAMADTLACQDFLWLLPTLYRVERSEAALQLLCSVLAHLAVDLLDAAAWGLADATELGAFLFSAVPVLPDANEDWACVLEDWGYLPLVPLTAVAGPRVAGQLLVLLHAYFRAIVGSDGDLEGQSVLAQSLPAYVLSLPAQHRAPASVLKLIWVTFAVNCVLATDVMTEAARAASSRLTQLLNDLEARGALANAFTAHPCLVYWAFQAKAVSPQMQQAVLALWLSETGDAASTAAPVLEIVEVHTQAVHPLLDVVTTAPKQAAEAAARILHQAASKQRAVAADLGAGLWGRLPLSLSRCGGAQDSDEGCGLLVWLAAEVYEPPPAEMALRVANLLGGVLGRQRLSAPRHLTAAMYILRKLLEDCRARSDPRVHATLLSDARFAKAVLSAAGEAGEGDAQVCATALNLLRHLEQDNARLKAPVVLDATPLEVGTLLLAVTSGNLDVAEAGVALLLEVLKAKPHPFLVLEDNDEITRSLYFELQNYALKVRGSPSTRDAVWRALTALLPRGRTLGQQPWNHVLIKFNLTQSAVGALGEDFLAFVLAWLRRVAPSEPPEPTPRRPVPTMLTETSIVIASALVEAGPDFQKRPIVRDIAQALLRATADLPPTLMSSVQGFAAK